MNIQKISNGFLVTVYAKDHTGEDTVNFCKNVAQVVKLVKSQYKQPVQVPF